MTMDDNDLRESKNLSTRRCTPLKGPSEGNRVLDTIYYWEY